MPETNQITKSHRLILAALVAGSLLFHVAILWESRREIAAGYGYFIGDSLANFYTIHGN
jgi:hypothetical protein